MSMTHEVKQGEALADIARRYGFGDWKKVWEYEDNREKHPSPNTLKPGTIVKIPELKTKSETVKTGEITRFTIKRPKQELRLTPQNQFGEGYAGKPYRLEVDQLEVPFEGTIPESGIIKHRVPFSSKYARLIVFPYDEFPTIKEEWRLRINQLNPVEGVDGAQQRLKNLGIKCGPVDNLHGPRTMAALKYFQTIHELEPTGKLDEATMEALKKPTKPIFPEGETGTPLEQIAQLEQESESDVTALFRFKLVNASGEPVSGQPFRFKHSRGTITRGITDHEGYGNIRDVSSSNGIVYFPNMNLIFFNDDGSAGDRLEVGISPKVVNIVENEQYEFRKYRLEYQILDQDRREPLPNVEYIVISSKGEVVKTGLTDEAGVLLETDLNEEEYTVILPEKESPPEIDEGRPQVQIPFDFEDKNDEFTGIH